MGWYEGRISANTRRLVSEKDGILYDSDSYADELPYWQLVNDVPVLILPYSLDVNDFKFLTPNGFVTGDDFFQYARDSFEQLWQEGGRVMSIGLHCRSIGRPGRAHGLKRFLEHVKARHSV